MIAPAVPMHDGETFQGAPVPVYPNTGQAVPAVSPEQMMTTQKALIDKVQQTSGMSHADFNNVLLPVIREYAAFVHLLPASENHHHCRQGGLFRHGLEVMFYAALKCESAVFALDHTPSERRRLDPRWRACAMIGGILHDIGKPMVDVGAIDASGTRMWSPHTHTLYDWLVANDLRYYYIHWHPGARHKRHEGFTTIAIYRIVPNASMEWLIRFHGQEAMDAMLRALSGDTDPNNPLGSIITGADSDSVARDLIDARKREAASGLGGSRSLASRIIRAIHDYVAEGKTNLNTPGQVLWVTTKGVFGIFPEIIALAIEACREQGDTSLPKNYGSIMEILSDHGYIDQRPDVNGQTHTTWRIRLHAMDRGKEILVPVQGIRFVREDVIPSIIVRPTPINADILDAKGNVVDSSELGHEQPSAQTTQAPGEPVEPAPAPAPTTTAAPAPIMAASPNETATSATSDEHGMPPSPPSIGKTGKAGKSVAPAESQLSTPQNTNSTTGDGEIQAGNTAPVYKNANEHSDGDVLEDGQGAEDEVEPLRDRSTEIDVRDQMMDEARANMADQWPPASPQDATKWFEAHPPEGDTILAVAERIQSGQLVEGRDVLEAGGFIHIRYPVGWDMLGVPCMEIVRDLEKIGWTERDPSTRSRGTVSVKLPNGKTMAAIRINTRISQAFRLLMPPASAHPSDNDADETQSSGKRVVPLKHLGPEIDEALAAKIDATSLGSKEVASGIRLAFCSFYAKKQAIQNSPDEPKPNEWRALVREFCKFHKITVTGKVAAHLTAKANPYLTVDKRDAEKPLTSARLYRNPDYDPAIDGGDTQEMKDTNEVAQ